MWTRDFSESGRGVWGCVPIFFFFSLELRGTWTRTQWTCPWPRPVVNVSIFFYRARARVHAGSETSHQIYFLFVPLWTELFLSFFDDALRMFVF